jgi:hypothetical protein
MSGPAPIVALDDDAPVIRDPAVNKALDDAIGAMGAAIEPLAKLHAVRVLQAFGERHEALAADASRNLSTTWACWKPEKASRK